LKLKLDWTSINSAIRTAGAPMIGNALIAVLAGQEQLWRTGPFVLLGVAALSLEPASK
jgi:hypothetical protein